MDRVRIISFLVVVTCCSTVWSLYLWRGGDLWLNLATETSGLLLSVLAIDGLLTWREGADRRRLLRLAVLQLKRAVVYHLGLLQRMYKAGASGPPAATAFRIEDVLTDEFVSAIGHVDYGSPNFDAADPSFPGIRRWEEEAKENCERFKDAIDRCLTRFGHLLAPEAFEMLQGMVNSSFIGFCSSLQMLRTTSQRARPDYGGPYNWFGAPGMDELVREHAAAMIALVKFCNDHLETAMQIEISREVWRSDVAPRLGLSRVRDASRIKEVFAGRGPYLPRVVER